MPIKKSPEWVIWGNEAGWPSRNRSCRWCGRYCGRTDESVVGVALVHRDTRAERTWTLCPLCAYAPDATVESRQLWRAWRRAPGS
jgi:hypothetical protein